MVLDTNIHQSMNLANFAQASYTDQAPTGYAIDTELSGPDRKVYHNNHHAVIAFKGTTPTNWRDLSVDAAMGINVESFTNRFKNSLEVTKRAIEKYGKENLFLTGHSLGGSQALHVHQKTGIQGAAYNPFVSEKTSVDSRKATWLAKNLSKKDIDRFHLETIRDNFKVHTIFGDPVSLGVGGLPHDSIVYHKPPKGYRDLIYGGTRHPLGSAAKIMKFHDIGNFTSTGFV